MFIFICTPVGRALTHACLQTGASVQSTDYARVQGVVNAAQRWYVWVLFARCVPRQWAPRLGNSGVLGLLLAGGQGAFFGAWGPVEPGAPVQPGAE